MYVGFTQCVGWIVEIYHFWWLKSKIPHAPLKPSLLFIFKAQEISDGMHGCLQCHIKNSHIGQTRQEQKKEKKIQMQLFPIRPDSLQRKKKVENNGTSKAFCVTYSSKRF